MSFHIGDTFTNSAYPGCTYTCLQVSAKTGNLYDGLQWHSAGMCTAVRDRGHRLRRCEVAVVSGPSLQRLLAALDKHGIDFRMRDVLAEPLGLAVDDVLAEVRRETIEACAVRCNEIANGPITSPIGPLHTVGLRDGAAICATAIRALKEPA